MKKFNDPIERGVKRFGELQAEFWEEFRNETPKAKGEIIGPVLVGLTFLLLAIAKYKGWLFQ